MTETERSMDTLRRIRTGLDRAEKKRGQPGNEVPGSNSEGPPGHSFWDGDQWVALPAIHPLQVLRELVKNPSSENMETARWYALEWMG